MVTTAEHLHNLWRIGFPIVGLYDDSRTATYAYVKGNPPIFNNPDFWNAEKIDAYYYSGKFKNVAAVFGKTRIKDSQGDFLYLNGLDVDCEEANRRLSMPISELLRSNPNLPSKMITDFALVKGGIDDLSGASLLDVCKRVTYVTKSYKPYGHHIHWLSHHCYENITPNHCKQDSKFELFTGARAKLCHLPDSMHREHRDFRYQAVGLTDVIIRSDDLYTILTEIFKDLLVNEKIPEPESSSDSDEKHRDVLDESSRFDQDFQKDFQILSEKAVQLSIDYLSPYYINGDRQNFTLPFAGVTFREKISLKSASEILAGLCKKSCDDEIDNRLRALHDTYEKGFRNKRLIGGHTLAQLIAKMKGYDLQDAEGIVKMLKTIWAKDLADLDRDYDDMLIDENHFKTLKDTGEIWYYDHERGIFVPNGEPIIEARLEADFGRADPTDPDAPPPITNNRIKEHIGHIQRRTYIDRDDFIPDIAWIACKNCMINLITGEIQPFDPKFLGTTKIPVNYIKGIRHDEVNTNSGLCADFFRLVESSRIMRFLYEIMDPYDVDLFLDYMAYSLWRNYKYNFWMLLVGKGFNGKSILLDLIERFFGKENKSGETLDRLLNEKFSIANLFNKMVNVDADVSADVIFKNTGILKKLTGNDLHAAEYKFKRPFYFRNYAKLYFSCNKIPDTDDDTDAFFRRIFIINFTQQFFGDKDNPHLIDELCTDEQFSILLSELLSRLPRIVKSGLRAVTNEALAETYDKYMMSSDPVRSFYEKALAPEAGSRILKMDLYEYYLQFCQFHRLTPESNQSFSRKLTKDFHLKSKLMKVKGESYPKYFWLDVKQLDWQEVERQTQMNLEEIPDLSDQEKEAMK